MRRFVYIFGVIGLLMLWLHSGTVHAQSKSFYWESFDVIITVNPDGTFWVEEAQTINFTSGTFRYGYRSIPLAQVEYISDVQVIGDGVQYTESD
ncbi:MAG: DUF2207 domain-containing protein, partial [Anaerolineae bacterium]|nr:DUF2207 domain-containing protein [Anaerolineae bacterium]